MAKSNSDTTATVKFFTATENDSDDFDSDEADTK